MSANQQLSAAEYNGSVGKTKAALDKQDKKVVFIPQPHGSKPEHTTHKPMHVNGVFYFLRYGKPLSVPQTLYEMLVQSGDVMPQREEDMIYLPVVPKEVQERVWID